jgi:hypothetical protein
MLFFSSLLPNFNLIKIEDQFISILHPKILSLGSSFRIRTRVRYIAKKQVLLVPGAKNRAKNMLGRVEVELHTFLTSALEECY